MLAVFLSRGFWSFSFLPPFLSSISGNFRHHALAPNGSLRASTRRSTCPVGGLPSYSKWKYEHRRALRGDPGNAYPQPEPNATELPSSAPGRPKSVEL